MLLRVPPEQEVARSSRAGPTPELPPSCIFPMPPSSRGAALFMWSCTTTEGTACDQEDTSEGGCRPFRRSAEVRRHPVCRSNQQQVPDRYPRPHQGSMGIHPSAQQRREIHGCRATDDSESNQKSRKGKEGR